jgi:hypothetical protein
MPEPNADFEKLLAQLQEPDPPKPNGGQLPAPVNYNERLVPEMIPDDIYQKVRNLLGISPKRWDETRAKVLRDILPKFGLTKITARVSLDMGFNTIEHMVTAMEVGEKIMKSEDKDMEPITRIAAGKMMALAGDSLAKMLVQVQVLAEKSSNITEADRAPQQERHRNLPPLLPGQLNVQVNVGGQPQAAPVKNLPPAIVTNVPANSES